MVSTCPLVNVPVTLFKYKYVVVTIVTVPVPPPAPFVVMTSPTWKGPLAIAEYSSFVLDASVIV